MAIVHELLVILFCCYTTGIMQRNELKEETEYAIQYANIHGAPAASCYFARKLKHLVSESTMKSSLNRKKVREEVEPVRAIFAIV